MTDQELIQSLRMCSKVSCPECLKKHTVCYRRRWMNTAADRLEALEALVDQRWIPVTERLPEKVGEYLVLSKAGNYSIQWFYINENYKAFLYVENGTITHWMPLPDRPKEVKV